MTQQLSVINDMAQRFGMEKTAFEAVMKKTVFPSNGTNEQFVSFLLVAKQYNLNPILKEIYAFPAKSGGIVPIVGIDGWLNIINSHPQFDGMEFHDMLENGELVSVTCRIYRKDRQHPITVTEYMNECKGSSEPWRKWPARMLRHKATIQAARYAFGFSGIYDEDEARRMDAIDVTPKNVQASSQHSLASELKEISIDIGDAPEVVDNNLDELELDPEILAKAQDKFK